MTPPDWDDERLAAAFRARFDRPAPATLARAVHGAIVGTSPARKGLLRSGPGLSRAAAAVVVVLVVTLAVGLGGFGRFGGTPPPSGAAPGASATPTEQAVPGSVFGLPIIKVSDAIAIRDAVADDRELAVQGWFTPAPLISCRDSPAGYASPIQLRCPDEYIWLTEQAESLIHQAGSPLTSAPVGPALNPDLDDLDRSWQRPPPQVGDAIGDSTPTDVVFIGHFDDRRAALCPATEQTVCRDRFVVDSVAFVAGQARPRSLVQEGVTPVSSLPDIEAVVNLEAPQSTILSMAVVSGSGGLVSTEPSLRNGQQGLNQRPVLWVARVLETDRISTYVIIDGTDAIYEMNADGEAIPVGGSAPPPATSPAPWPPAGAVVIVLTSEVVPGGPPARVAVVDGSGRLTGVSEKGAVDPSTVTLDGRFRAYAEPGKPGRVHLTWVGGICDSQLTVTVAADLRSISFDMGPRVDCDSIGIGRQLVLDFSGSVDVPAIELREATASPTPTASARDYELDCGPLGPDTCEQKAAAVVAASKQGSPAKRVRSITFIDECGSYTVIFDDGTGITASIDCILP